VDPGPTDPARLERLVFGTRYSGFLDDAAEAALWAAVDSERAGRQLDDALVSASPLAHSTVAVARLLRLARIARVDLAAELAHPKAAVRAAAARYAGMTGATRHAAAVRALIGPPDRERAFYESFVWREAIDAVGALGDEEAVPLLSRITGTRGDPRAAQACAALFTMNRPNACRGKFRDAPTNQMTVESSSEVECAAVMDELAKGIERGVVIGWVARLLEQHFQVAARPWARLLSAPMREGPERSNACRLQPPVRDLLVSERVIPEVRGVAAAVMLWELGARLPAVSPGHP